MILKITIALIFLKIRFLKIKFLKIKFRFSIFVLEKNYLELFRTI